MDHDQSKIDMRTPIWLSLLLIPCLLPAALGTAKPATPEGPRYTAEGQLLKPDNYLEWVTIGTGLNMAYGPAVERANGNPLYTNVLVNPAAYRAFLDSGA